MVTACFGVGVGLLGLITVVAFIPYKGRAHGIRYDLLATVATWLAAAGVAHYCGW
jgi:hypothetical protein